MSAPAIACYATPDDFSRTNSERPPFAFSFIPFRSCSRASRRLLPGNDVAWRHYILGKLRKNPSLRVVDFAKSDDQWMARRLLCAL